MVWFGKNISFIDEDVVSFFKAINRNTKYLDKPETIWKRELDLRPNTPETPNTVSNLTGKALFEETSVEETLVEADRFSKNKTLVQRFMLDYLHGLIRTSFFTNPLISRCQNLKIAF